MDKQLDVCFDRVEKALGTLVDSIAKYHPSVAQVNELGLADVELNKGLEDLQTHQSNHRRIQDLRAATTSFDTQIKDTLRLLANTRKELVNAPATVFPSDRPSYDIDYDELLAYASRISKTTIPPAGAANGLSTEPKTENSGGPGIETAATTPAGGTPANTNGAQQQDLTSQSQQLATTGSGDAVATQEELPWKLNPFSDVEFVPWPSEESVRKGALVTLAFLSEKGIDPENYDPEEEKARKEREKEEQQAAEERERQEREERERRAREEQARLRAEREKEQREAWRRASVTGGAGPSQSSPVGEKKQFQFMADDDEDDDE
ncbi:uncharacterized protein F4817DRAFT_317346 [Daldinia loculata]|uniref:uncharacterized protein n=1 Tax=Daldinia loculata TaxID=103429 RepID=UPI0020C402EC|nr:uncharacterized protein F4817DRAFT_317346 [Daldinia loculata]KAI1645967.1 hypothetical protein F4817DRAFT_317346 [Daldinia loculata]